MDLTLELQETVKLLGDKEKFLMLEIAKRFLPDNIATPEDLHYIKIGEQELADGDTGSWDNIDWDEDNLSATNP